MRIGKTLFFRLVLAAGALLAADCQALDLDRLDPLSAQDAVPAWPSGNVLPPAPTSGQDVASTGNPCADSPLPAHVGLYEAVGRALCHNPQTLQAWAMIKYQAAQVGTSQSAYLPRLDATVSDGQDHTVTNVSQAPALSTQDNSRLQVETLNFSWLLLDFGTRAAHLENARQLLLAARQDHASVLQSVFLTTAKDYYATVAAQAVVTSTTEMAAAARNSLDAATAREEGGVAATTDRLQAKTAYAQALFSRARAEGELRSALGILALDMGALPDSVYAPADTAEGGSQDVSFVHNVKDLLQQARSHPSILSARASLAAARARQKAALSDGLPTLGLGAHVSRNTQPVSPGLGYSDLGAVTHDRYVGLELHVPLFNGFGDLYRYKTAAADVEVQQDKLAYVEQQVSQNVWVSYQAFETNTENLQNTDTLLSSAREQFAAAQERYQTGVATILELMSAQTSLSDALQQRIRAMSDWRTSRLALAGSIGQLGPWAIRDPARP